VNFDKVCVLGLGYIGLPISSILATHGTKVVGMDINPQIILTLQKGALHIHEPGLRALAGEALGSGNLAISSQVEPADAFIIAVPTPFYDDKRADMRAVSSAAASIVPHLRPGNLVVLESTSPPRTTADLVAPILEESGMKAGKDFYLVYSPERVLPGQIIKELVENARVIGGIDRDSAEAGRDLYRVFVQGEIVLTDATTAEMVKLMENTYRDINIAIANEFARLADHFGVDAWEAIEIANRHPRVKILRPGPGVGGHCVSVDPWFLVEAAPDLSPLVRTARQVNDSQPRFALECIRRALGGVLAGKRVAVLGLAFKPEVDDLRESPAIEVARMLVEEGTVVSAYEPYKPDADLGELRMAPTLEAAVRYADAVVLMVRHASLRQLDPRAIAPLMGGRVAVDCDNGWDRPDWEAAGFRYSRLGGGR
jgi:UDP-N-acetyl-D-mannosaminuronic acid dehydrogenase